MGCIHTCVLAIAMIAASGFVPCAAEPTRPREPTVRLKAQRVDLPDVLGVQVGVVVPEFPAEAIAEGERATFELEFEINLRGNVIESKMVSSSHPALDDYLLRQHRSWVYAVATRERPCSASRYRGLQRFSVSRVGGKLKAELEPAAVLEIFARQNYERADASGVIPPSNYRQVMESIEYPRAALDRNVEGRVMLLAEFGADGKVIDVYPVNAAYDRWGFAVASIKAARRLEFEGPVKPFVVCVPVEFRIR